MSTTVSNADIARELHDLKEFVEAENKKQNAKIDQVLAAFEASKWLVKIVAGLAAIAAAVMTAASVVHNWK
jgi:hypothetical protein